MHFFLPFQCPILEHFFHQDSCSDLHGLKYYHSPRGVHQNLVRASCLPQPHSQTIAKLTFQ